MTTMFQAAKEAPNVSCHTCPIPMASKFCFQNAKVVGRLPMGWGFTHTNIVYKVLFHMVQYLVIH